MTELIKKILVSNSIFEKDTVSVNILGSSLNLKGSATNQSMYNAFLASLGEFTERAVELSFPEGFNKIVSYDLLNNKIISKNYIDGFLLRNKDDFFNLSTFGDSSGSAFFTNIKMAIEKAFFEFIERQSLVYSFLTKSPGFKVDNNLIANSMKNYRGYDFTTLYVNNISLVDNVVVILIVGVNNNSYNIGLGTGYTYKQAISKALSEAMGTRPNKITSYKIKEREQELDSLDADLCNLSSIQVSYDSIFFDNLTPNFVKKRYSYLDEGNEVHNIKTQNPMKNNTIIKNIKIVASELQIEPQIMFLGSGPSKTKSGYVIKISAPGCYPHIFNSLLDPLKYKISFFKNKKGIFPNAFKYLPFP
ncbi:YcaO-like family protein [Lactobacillus sp. ESL0684]|uniref:YcaO-like family protein n=1 Tax=Lactobacillus sp. ESL0684 TaxID=2983213 RepID=UPI0023F9E617|nr:YcaO-like family protein [Lactobacillus sp. ESL0684]WEV43867.1 YcaO-like family protein [Lactobacillus sp. ESL0684]